MNLKTVTTTVQVSARRSPLANSDPNYIALRNGKLTKVYRVNHLVLRRDVGVFTFRSGSFSFLPPVLGKVMTGVFVGEGNFQLTPAYPAAVQHLHRLAGMDSVTEDFGAMVLYFGDSTFDEVVQQSELVDEAPDRHEAAFKRVKDAKAIEVEPKGAAKYHYNLGVFLLGANQSKEATEEFRRAIESDPAYAEAQYQYSVTLLAMRPRMRPGNWWFRRVRPKHSISTSSSSRRARTHSPRKRYFRRSENRAATKTVSRAKRSNSLP